MKIFHIPVPEGDEVALNLYNDCGRQVKAAGGTLVLSLGFQSQPAILVMGLPDGYHPSQFLPDRESEELVEVPVVKTEA